MHALCCTEFNGHLGEARLGNKGSALKGYGYGASQSVLCFSFVELFLIVRLFLTELCTQLSKIRFVLMQSLSTFKNIVRGNIVFVNT